MTEWITIILIPVAILVAFVVTFIWVIGAMVCLNIYKSGKYPEIDTSNYIGRLLGFVQLSRHIPKLMRSVFVFRVIDDIGQMPLHIEPSVYDLKGEVINGHNIGGRTVRITRPLLNMNRQDLMEQLDFRPDDGRVT